ncbi:MAG: uridine phosphorylase [Oligoflexia bacterium]|nr:uridine phosphorylase [Oligoflexia bacterium]
MNDLNWKLRDLNGPFSAADLVLKDGHVYHLDVAPGAVAEDIIIVGDPGRARMIRDQYLQAGTIEIDHEHRGLRTVTGVAKSTGQRITVTTSGMGTPSIEIVLNELDALNTIDFSTRKRLSTRRELHIIRVGTSGALQESSELGSCAITAYAAGFDNTALFYDAPYADAAAKGLEERLRSALWEEISRQGRNPRFARAIHPYIAKGDANAVAALEQTCREHKIKFEAGITVSHAGFFNNQGRDLSPIPNTVDDFELFLAHFDPKLHGLRMLINEMETSFLCHFAGALGYRATSICTMVAHRRLNTYVPDMERATHGPIGPAIQALQLLRKG